MSTLCLHRGAELVDERTLSSYKAPAATQSYQPVSHSDLMKEARFAITQSGCEIDSVEVGVQNSFRNKALIRGAKMFSLIRLKSEKELSGDDLHLDIALRNSYDKSLSVGVSVGSSVFICDNLMITGEVQVARKHTVNVWRDIYSIFKAIMTISSKQHKLDNLMKENLKEISINYEKGLNFIGAMAATGKISYFGGVASPFHTAIAQWREPSFEEFHDRNMWSLYNACTFGTKKTKMLSKLEEGMKITSSFRSICSKEIIDESIKINNEIKETREELINSR